VAGHRIFGGAKERTTMSTCFERTPRMAQPEPPERDRLIRRGRGSNRHDAFRSTLVKDFFGGFRI